MMPADLIGVLTYRGLLTGCEQYAAGQSDDPVRQVGAKIVDKHGQVVSFGANHLPRGVLWDQRRVTRPLKSIFLEHAERDAIYHAARWGIRLDGATMVAPWAACAECARAIIAAGITSLVRRPIPLDRWSYSIGLGDQMLREAGVEIVELKYLGHERFVDPG